MKKILVLLPVLFFVFKTNAQAPGESDFGSWMMWFNSLKINGKWKIDSDFHLRNWQLAKDPNTLLLRAGLTHSPNNWLELTAGYAYIEGYAFEGAEDWKTLSTEHRIWEQLVAKHKNWGISFHHRFRVEQRFVNTASDFYQDRLRYRFLLSRPFLKNKPALYGFGSYEHFFTAKDFKFDQGRLHIGLGYTLSKRLKLEAAYLRHFLKGGLEFNRLQLNVITSFF